jgi:hypothetical protein
MSAPAFLAPRALMARKPPHGKPCNRCGACCIATLCPLAVHVFRQPVVPGPCPALRWNGPDAVCGLAAAPRVPPDMREAARWLIGADTGCDARFNGEPADPAFYDRLKAWDRQNAPEVAAARATWGLDTTPR